MVDRCADTDYDTEHTRPERGGALDSNFSRASRSTLLISAVASVSPVSDRSRILNRRPPYAPLRWYMRMTSAATSAASSPPVPARTSRIALR